MTKAKRGNAIKPVQSYQIRERAMARMRAFCLTTPLAKFRRAKFRGHHRHYMRVCFNARVQLPVREDIVSRRWVLLSVCVCAVAFRCVFVKQVSVYYGVCCVR